MKTASEMSYIPKLWAAEAARMLAKETIVAVVNGLTIDANSCEHCGRHIPDWDVLEPHVPGVGKFLNQVALKRGPDNCFGRLCGLCEVGMYH